MLQTVPLSYQEFFTAHTTMVYVIQVMLTYTIVVCTVKNT